MPERYAGGMHGAWVWADIQDWLAGRGWRSAAFDTRELADRFRCSITRDFLDRP